MTDRHLIVVDIESTGLDVNTHVPLEIAAINVNTGEELHFVPWVSNNDLQAADPIALSVNRYYERRLFEQTLDQEANRGKALELAMMLNGNTFAGSNPAYDSAILRKWLDKFSDGPCQWHYRLADLAAYTAGALGIDPTDSPGLHRACELLHVTNDGEHTALGDARATAECFRKLVARKVPA